MQFESRYLVVEAHALLGLGHLDRARSSANEAVDAALAHGGLEQELHARVVRAGVLVRTGDADGFAAACADLERALALVEETGARAWEPQVREAFAELACAEGDDAGRERELRAALRLYTEMGITAYAERVQMELAR
jgi:hypothetical protein